MVYLKLMECKMTKHKLGTNKTKKAEEELGYSN